MKILFCITSLTGGGAETQLFYLSKELIKNGYDVHVFYVLGNRNEEKKKWAGVNLHFCDVKSNYSFKIFYKLFYLLKNNQFDIVQTWVVQMDVLVGFLSFLFNFKWIIRESSSEKNYNNSFKIKLRIFFSKNSSIIVSNSIAGSNYWQKKNKFTNKIVINNGIPYDNIERELLSNNYSVNIFGDYILSVGRLIENGTARKNVLKLIYAFDKLKSKGKKYNLVIVGEGKDRIFLEDKVRNLGLENSVFFTGNLDRGKIYILMKYSKMFISLSEYEGCPNTVLESFFCCKNILLSNIHEHNSLFDTVNSYDPFVNLNSIDEICDKILFKLTSQSSDYRILTKKYTIDNMVNSYINLYHKLILLN